MHVGNRERQLETLVARRCQQGAFEVTGAWAPQVLLKLCLQVRVGIKGCELHHELRYLCRHQELGAAAHRQECRHIQSRIEGCSSVIHVLWVIAHILLVDVVGFRMQFLSAKPNSHVPSSILHRFRNSFPIALALFNNIGCDTLAAPGCV